MPQTLKFLSRSLGVLLALACSVFVVWKLWLLAPQISMLVDWPVALKDLALASIVYFVASLFLALGWWLLLRSFADRKIPLEAATRGHMRAQIAKYLPGNVFHYAARHAHAKRNGSDHFGAAAAALAESMLLVSVAVAISIAVPSTDWPDALRWLAPWKGLLLAGLLAGVVTGQFLMFRRGAASGGASNVGLQPLALAMVCHTLFFLLATLALSSFLNDDAGTFLTMLSALAIAWLGGFLVIGAPGGIGVREAILVGLLGPSIGDAQALYAALAFRCTTILGDFLVFLASFTKIGRRC